MIRTSDEDWSIISSSSDIDEERSTTSSNDGGPSEMNWREDNINHQSGDNDDGVKSNDMSQEGDRLELASSDMTDHGYLQSTLTGNLSNGNDVDVTEGADVDEPGPISNGSPIFPQLDAFTDNNASTEQCQSKSPDDKPVAKIISFYENLSENTLKLHKSIKHQSDQLYQNVARKRLMVLNRYMQANDVKPDEVIDECGQDCSNGSGLVEGMSTKRPGINNQSGQITHNEGLVKVHSRESHPDTSLIDSNNSDEPQPCDGFANSKIMCGLSSWSPNTITKFKDGFILNLKTCVHNSIGILDENSEYLIYFLAVLLGVGSCLYYTYVVFMVSPKPKTLTETFTENLLANSRTIWNRVLYEESKSSGWFYTTPKKELRITKFGHKLTNHSNQLVNQWLVELNPLLIRYSQVKAHVSKFLSINMNQLKHMMVSYGDVLEGRAVLYKHHYDKYMKNLGQVSINTMNKVKGFTGLGINGFEGFVSQLTDIISINVHKLDKIYQEFYQYNSMIFQQTFGQVFQASKTYVTKSSMVSNDLVSKFRSQSKMVTDSMAQGSSDLKTRVHEIFHDMGDFF